MVLANQTTVSGHDYVDVLSRANLHHAFEQAWSCELDDHVREQDGLGSVSEDVIIEKTLAKSDDLWGFSMNVNNKTHPTEVTYHLVPFQQHSSKNKNIQNWQTHEVSIVRRNRLSRLEDSVKCAHENRPEDPEIVSYALDDMLSILNKMEYEQEDDDTNSTQTTLDNIAE